MLSHLKILRQELYSTVWKKFKVQKKHYLSERFMCHLLNQAKIKETHDCQDIFTYLTQPLGKNCPNKICQYGPRFCFYSQ